MKISEITEWVIAYHPPFTREHTTDVIKFGDPEQECTGVVVTCFPSIDVIRRTAELGANFLIVHEPLFWSHEDTTGWLENSAVYQTKRQLLSDAGIVVWRDHDHMHGEGWGPKRVNLDGMYDGIMRELGWEPYLVESKKKPLVFQIPETDGEALGHELMEKLNLKGIRIVGDRHTKVSRVFLCEHIGSNDRNAEEKLLRTEMEEYDALIPLEIIDWTLCAYIRDSCQAGRPKVLYNVGHFNLEELGMRYMARWLPGLLDGQVPVTYVQSGDAFDFIL